jgi:LmbE family N-acetylglucosaminyl deacetylase/protein-L-isoaspartate O-methyltransferase
MQQIFNADEFRNSAVPADPKFLASINSCLVLAPHQDDESLGCGGLIAYLTGKGRKVSVIFTTDGSASHLNSVSFPKEKLTALRNEEAIKALEFLGVPKDQVTFYNGKDSGLGAEGENGFAVNVERLKADISNLKPELILVPYELDPHRDHRATWQMLVKATEALSGFSPNIWEYPIWLYQNAIQEDLPSLKGGELKSFDVQPYILQKKQAIAAHVSQTTDLISDDPAGFRLLPDMIANFTTGIEYFMQRAKLNLGATLTQGYFDKVYEDNSDPWDFETSDYERAKYQHTIQSLPEEKYGNALEIGCSIGVLTKMIAEHCDTLVSIDISEKALEVAKKRLADETKVTFRVAAIPDSFPEGMFDLIVMSEVGYYLSLKDLKKTITQIEQQLNIGGTLIIVHWTHYVKDYPLTGDEVHECFAESKLTHLHGDRTKDYRLDVYQNK